MEFDALEGDVKYFSNICLGQKVRTKKKKPGLSIVTSSLLLHLGRPGFHSGIFKAGTETGSYNRAWAFLAVQGLLLMTPESDFFFLFVFNLALLLQAN